jgi:hypothetical protein
MSNNGELSMNVPKGREAAFKRLVEHMVAGGWNTGNLHEQVYTLKQMNEVLDIMFMSVSQIVMAHADKTFDKRWKPNENESDVRELVIEDIRIALRAEGYNVHSVGMCWGRIFDADFRPEAPGNEKPKPSGKAITLELSPRPE